MAIPAINRVFLCGAVMNQKQTSESTADLTGALSNDLFRVVSLQQRGAVRAAQRFLSESKRWAGQLKHRQEKRYIIQIAEDLDREDEVGLTQEKIEKYLMYAVLLQNYTLHIK